MYEAKAYHCSHCKKYGLSKSWIVKHEVKCFHNPITRSCSTCGNRMADVVVYPEHGHGYTKEVPYCLEAISLKPSVFLTENPDKVKFHTDCGKWVERSEEDEELYIYQRQKSIENITKVILESSEYPF